MQRPEREPIQTWQRRGRVAGYLLLLLFTALIIQRGVIPAFGNAKGDFANYYTASRIVAQGGPIERAYRDFIWFQKQVDLAGFQNQLGAFIPHPPPTALVFFPLLSLPPRVAKQAWVLANLIMAVCSVFLLHRLSGLGRLETGLLFTASGAALINNFLFGQLYLLLLFSILAGLLLARRDHAWLAGISIGWLLPVKYVGLLWTVYFAWKRNWRLVAGVILGASGICLLALWFSGSEAFVTFVYEVLPRHLRGEIQNPFDSRFQTWNSLFRRLFVFQETLNPHPPLESPLLFYLSRNLVLWSLAGFSAAAIIRAQSLSDTNHRRLFETGLIPLVILLLAPSAATYQFLLLTIPVTFFCKILLDRKWPVAALGLGLLFVIVNFPHYLYLESLATGWWTPLAYSRLWALLIFFFASLSWLGFLGRFSFRPVLAFTGLGTLIALAQFGLNSKLPEDGAQWIQISGRDFDSNPGMVLESPDLAKDNLLFTYCELNNSYTIYSSDGSRWLPSSSSRNYYSPDLAANGAGLLVETVEKGEEEIWFSPARRVPPRPLRPGRSPSWHPDGEHYVFEREGDVFLAGLGTETPETLVRGENAYDVSFSPDGKQIVYCTREERGTSLRLFDLETRASRSLLSSPEQVAAPALSPDGSKVVFSWNKQHNRDLWAIDIRSLELLRLTTDRGADDDPVWDDENQRIVFDSDRGRGPEFSALYWIPIPEELRRF